MQRFSNILVSIDAAATAQPVLECAAQLAVKHGAQLKVVDVVPEFGWAQRFLLAANEHLHDLLERERAELLTARAAPLQAQGLNVVTKVLRGRTSAALIAEAEAGKHDLVMRNAKGLKSRRIGAFGTTSFELLRRCPTAVYLHQSAAPVKFDRIAAAVDANPEEPEMSGLNQRILEAAVAVRDLTHGRLDVVHVWSIYGERMVKDYMRTSEFAELEQSVRAEHAALLTRLLSDSNVDLPSEAVHLVRGEPSIELPNFVRENSIDLLVMGTVGRRGMAGLLLGNTAEMVLNQLSCSVLAVKPPPAPVTAHAAPLFPPEMPPVP